MTRARRFKLGASGKYRAVLDSDGRPVLLYFFSNFWFGGHREFCVFLPGVGAGQELGKEVFTDFGGSARRAVRYLNEEPLEDWELHVLGRDFRGVLDTIKNRRLNDRHEKRERGTRRAVRGK